MKNESTKSPKKQGNPDGKDDRWIDVHDDDVMRAMGLWRPYNQKPRDPSVWTKTPAERRLLKKLRHTWKGLDMHFHSVPRKRGVVRAKLIIQLLRNNIFPKTTYSQECWNTEVGDILRKFMVTDPKTGYEESAVAKYSFNGKTYGPKELPFCG